MNASRTVARDENGVTPTERRQQPEIETIRVAVVCDLLEEGWHSMDLVADMLLSTLQRDYGREVTATRIRPAMRRRACLLVDATEFGAIGPSRHRRLLFNADRLANRFWDYPRHLATRTAHFDAFHVVDHSYAQLLHVLPPRARNCNMPRSGGLPVFAGPQQTPELRSSEDDGQTDA